FLASLMDVETSPNHNVPMKSAEIIAEEESPKHNVEIACAKTLEENNVEEIKTVEIRDEDVYPKPIVETEDIIDEMESIDIHGEDKTVSLECETQQDKMRSPSNDYDDEHDSESSHDSKDDVDEDETMDDKETPKPDSPDSNPSTSAWTEKAAAIKNFVRVKSEVAVQTVMRRLSGRMNDDNAVYDARDVETKSVESPKTEGKSSIWNPLSYLKMMQNNTVDKVEVKNVEEAELEPVIIRGNHRQPYHLAKPFNEKDKRSMVKQPYEEAKPLSHFALVCGTRSGPPLRCFSPGEIDKELMEATRDFLRGGGLLVDLSSKVAYISKIFNWYAVDFGNGEKSVLKHASTYLEPQLSEALLDVLVDTQFRVVYQTYDWGLNH
ncbi:hypothetical protein DY000_02014675, partial [Brassica cretica]